MAGSTQKPNICRICGYDFGVPVRDEYGFPDYSICNACGAEAGVDDETMEEVQAYRNQWLSKGAQWDDSIFGPPKNWNPQEQMKNIPPEWF